MLPQHNDMIAGLVREDRLRVATAARRIARPGNHLDLRDRLGEVMIRGGVRLQRPATRPTIVTATGAR